MLTPSGIVQAITFINGLIGVALVSPLATVGKPVSSCKVGCVVFVVVCNFMVEVQVAFSYIARPCKCLHIFLLVCQLYTTNYLNNSTLKESEEK